MLRLLPDSQREAARAALVPLAKQLTQFGDAQSERIRAAVDEQARRLGINRSIKPSREPSEIPVIASTIVKRKRFGTIPVDDLPQDQWQGYPSGAWDLIPITALYWCDGQRTLAAIIHLTRLEQGPSDFDFVGYFRFLRDHGYVEFVKGK